MYYRWLNMDPYNNALFLAPISRSPFWSTQLSRIKSNFDLFCAFVWNLTYFPQDLNFLKHRTISGHFCMYFITLFHHPITLSSLQPSFYLYDSLFPYILVPKWPLQRFDDIWIKTEFNVAQIIIYFVFWPDPVTI